MNLFLIKNKHIKLDGKKKSCKFYFRIKIGNALIIKKGKKNRIKTQIFYTLGSLIYILLFLAGCNNQDKWKAVPLNIKKQESFNYSEMISGELDSTEKDDLEAVKEKTTQEMESNTKRNSDSSSKSNSKETSLINKVWHRIKNIYSWFIDLF